MATEPRLLRPAIFLDRDGTINVEKNYLYKPQDWEWIGGAIDAIRAFNHAGYLVVVVSNQAGVARGFYRTADVDALHAYVDQILAEHAANIDAYYYCPHHPDFGEHRDCNCRKPKPELLLTAQRDLGIDMLRSWMIGDKLSDIQAGTAAGARSLLVSTGYGAHEAATLSADTPYTKNLTTAAHLILTTA